MRLSELDPRLKIIAALCMAVLTLQAHFMVLAAMLVILGCLNFALGLGNRFSQGGLYYLLFFVILWMLIKGLLEIWQGTAPEQALLNAALLGARLFIFIFLGLFLTLSTSARQLGLGLSSLSRPLLGSKSWQVSLALSLMLHFLPLTLHSFAQVKQGYRSRSLELSFWRRFILHLQAGMRILSDKTWEQTLALAARNLDSAEAWEQKLGVNPWQWGLLSVFLGGLFALNIYLNTSLN